MKKILSHSCPLLLRLAVGQITAFIPLALLLAFPGGAYGQTASPSGGKPSPPSAAESLPPAAKDKPAIVKKAPVTEKNTVAAANDNTGTAKDAPPTAANPPDAAGSILKVQLPDGQYLVWITQGKLTSQQTLVQNSGPVALSFPGAGPAKLWVFDPAADRMAVVDTAPGQSVPVTSINFTQAGRVMVHLEDHDKKPLDFATVTLKAGDQTQVQQLVPTDGGTVSFSGVPLGEVTVTAVRNDATSFTKANIGKNENPQSGSDASSIDLALTINALSSLPVVSRIQPTDESDSSGAGLLAPSTSGKSGRSQTASTALGTAKGAGQKTTSQQAPPNGSRAGYLVALLLLTVLVVAAIWGFRNPERLRIMAGPWLERLGLQFPGGDDPGLAAHPAAPGADTAVSSSICAFCGTHKDPVTGSCACTLVPAGVKGAPSSALSAMTPVSSGSIAGPRFITLDGPLTGQVFSVAAESSIGRDTTNTIALAEDTAVSRRHARVSSNAGQIEIIDEGSSNGTFVNGARVDRQVLRPTDEVLIGHSLFRFEV